MSEQALHNEAFGISARAGVFCGPDCSGWHVSETDTWHYCGECNPGGKLVEHPEVADDCGEPEHVEFLVTSRAGARTVPSYLGTDHREALWTARSLRKSGAEDVHLRRVKGEFLERARAVKANWDSTKHRY